MESMFIAFIILLLVIYYLGLGVWVFAGLLLVSTTGLVFLIDMPMDRIGKIMAPLVIRSATSWEISAIPMFIWMGELMLRTDMSDRLFRGLSPLTYHLPGRLLHTNIAGSALFAAISGSSAATTATVGKITISELGKRGYSKSLTYGSLAGAGSLGLLIPPSIVMIVYGVLAEVSIARLFAAGVFPGVMIAALYSGYVIIVSVLNSSVAPPDRDKPGLKDAAIGLLNLIPIALLIFIAATGKSAQIPLFVWLPDAMAGPTPVSALIHAATMVTAGVYLVVRSHEIYAHTGAASLAVAIIGTVTLLFGAWIGSAKKDIKKVVVDQHSKRHCVTHKNAGMVFCLLQSIRGALKHQARGSYVFSDFESRNQRKGFSGLRHSYIVGKNEQQQIKTRLHEFCWNGPV